MAAVKPFPRLLLLLTALLLLPSSIGAAPAQDQDSPPYAQFTSDAANFPKETEYDFVIVGGGTAGCPLAATLSKSHRVLLLERGRTPADFPWLSTQDGFLRTLVFSSAPDSPAQPFVSEDGIPNARGRVLGGSSAINAGFYSRAHPDFFNESAWDLALVNQSYEWVEKKITFMPVLRRWQSAVRDALIEAHVTPNNNYTVHHLAGTKIGASTFDRFGLRHSAANLLELAKVPDNLRVALQANVDRILFNSLPAGRGNRHARRRGQPQVSAIGVQYRDQSNRTHRAVIRPGGEVILCAGALGSPQLLLLSGVGPREDLSAMGITVVAHQPHVGQYMYDNPRNGISIVPSTPLDHSLIQVVGITGDNKAFLEAASTVIPFPSPRASPFFHRPGPLYVTVASLIEKVAGPASFGSLHLATLDSRDNPVVRFNYFADPEDLDRCVAGMRKVWEVLDGRSMDEFRLSRWATGASRGPFRFVGLPRPPNRSDDEAMRRFCRDTVTTIWHYHGGCLVGKVLDGDYRVMGVGSLRVIDGSTFAVSPGTNPQATLMMMGRYMGVKILDEKRRMSRHRRRRPLHH